MTSPKTSKSYTLTSNGSKNPGAPSLFQSLQEAGAVSKGSRQSGRQGEDGVHKQDRGTRQGGVEGQLQGCLQEGLHQLEGGGGRSKINGQLLQEWLLLPETPPI